MRLSASKLAFLAIALLACAGASNVFAQVMGPAMYQRGSGPYGGAPAMGPGAYQPGPGAQYGGPMMEPGQCSERGQCECDDESCESEGFFGHLFGCCDEPRWTLSGDLLCLERSSPRSQTLFSTPPATNLPQVTGEVFNANEFDFPLPLAFQASAIRHGVFGSCFDLEVGYFQVDSWVANGDIPGTNRATIDNNGPSITMTNVSARYVSSLFLGEINLRKQWTDWLNLLVGFRMGELDEQYRANDAFSAFSFRTFNHLYGFQVGGDATLYDQGCGLSVHALCKAGIYGNQVAQRFDLQNGPTLDAKTTQTTFIGETGLLLKYQFNCHLAVRCTAEAAWLEGVALAPEQVSVTDVRTMTAAVDSHGSLFYYGGGLGVEVRY
jgi:hypothetical protein